MNCLCQRLTSGAPSAMRRASGVGFFFHLAVRHHAIYQPLAVSLVGLEHAAFEQDFQRHGFSHQREQSDQLPVGHGETQLVNRDAEAARLPANAQVAHRRDFEPAADAGALDHRHRRVPAARDRLHGFVNEVAVGLCLPRVGALRGEFRDIRAGGERLLARPAHDDAAQRIIRGQLAHHLAQPRPHRALSAFSRSGLFSATVAIASSRSTRMVSPID